MFVDKIQENISFRAEKKQKKSQRGAYLENNRSRSEEDIEIMNSFGIHTIEAVRSRSWMPGFPA